MVTQHHHGDAITTYYNYHSDAVFLHMYIIKLTVVKKAMETMGRHLNDYIIYMHNIQTLKDVWLLCTYHIRGAFDSNFNLAVWQFLNCQTKSHRQYYF